MARKLKVWGTTMVFVPPGHPAASRHSGQARGIVAASSQREAAMALRMSTYSFRNYASTTENEMDVAVAIAHPGVAIYQATNSYGGTMGYYDITGAELSA